MRQTRTRWWKAALIPGESTLGAGDRLKSYKTATNITTTTIAAALSTTVPGANATMELSYGNEEALRPFGLVSLVGYGQTKLRQSPLTVAARREKLSLSSSVDSLVSLICLVKGGTHHCLGSSPNGYQTAFWDCCTELVGAQFCRHYHYITILTTRPLR